jgi:hypothetical protein
MMCLCKGIRIEIVLIVGIVGFMIVGYCMIVVDVMMKRW